MSFSKTELRTILRENSIENITTDLLNALCDLHTDTQQRVVAVEVEKAKQSLQQSIDELQKQVDSNTTNGTNAEKFTKEIEDLKAEIETYKGREKTAQQHAEFKEVLNKAQIDPLTHEDIIKLTDFENIDFADENLANSLKEKYPSFVIHKTTQIHEPATPPAKVEEQKDMFLEGLMDS